MEEEENECERRTNYYVWRSVVHGRKCVQPKEHERKLCVANSCNGVHEMISMTKSLDFLLKWLFLLNPPLNLSQTSKKINLGSVECSLKILTSLGLLQGSYICRK